MGPCGSFIDYPELHMDNVKGSVTVWGVGMFMSLFTKNY